MKRITDEEIKKLIRNRGWILSPPKAVDMIAEYQEVADAQLKSCEAEIKELCSYCDTPLLKEGEAYLEIERKAREIFIEDLNRLFGLSEDGFWLRIHIDDWEALKGGK